MNDPLLDQVEDEPAGAESIDNPADADEADVLPQKQRVDEPADTGVDRKMQKRPSTGRSLTVVKTK